jgi:hypothetical protein
MSVCGWVAGANRGVARLAGWNPFRAGRRPCDAPGPPRAASGGLKDLARENATVKRLLADADCGTYVTCFSRGTAGAP